MSVWWIPAAMIAGWVLGALAGRIARRRGALGTEPIEKPAPRQEPVKPVTVRARRDIPLDVWQERVSQSDAKTAAAWLQLSMAQQIATEAAQYVQVTCCYDPVKKVYEISARLRVVPWRSWE